MTLSSSRSSPASRGWSTQPGRRRDATDPARCASGQAVGKMPAERLDAAVCRTLAGRKCDGYPGVVVLVADEHLGGRRPGFTDDHSDAWASRAGSSAVAGSASSRGRDPRRAAFDPHVLTQRKAGPALRDCPVQDPARLCYKYAPSQRVRVPATFCTGDAQLGRNAERHRLSRWKPRCSPCTTCNRAPRTGDRGGHVVRACAVAERAADGMARGPRRRHEP